MSFDTAGLNRDRMDVRELERLLASDKGDSWSAEDEVELAKVLSSAKEAAALALSNERSSIKLSEADEAQYERLFNTVRSEVAQLRVVLEGAEAKERERAWLRHQTVGELDDTRLVDSATGARNVYKRRGVADPLYGGAQQKPKRLSFVLDLSSSMARFNGDGRLDRTCACAILVMEAMHGMQHKYHYEIVGHSGEEERLALVELDAQPSNRKDRLEVVRQMYTHASFCMSGDNTLPGAIRAVRAASVDKEAGRFDDYFVFLVSDANLAAYGVSPSALTEALTADKDVHAYAFFIADELASERIVRAMPPGRGHIVLDTRDLPRLFKQIFTAAVIGGVGVGVRGGRGVSRHDAAGAAKL